MRCCHDNYIIPFTFFFFFSLDTGGELEAVLIVDGDGGAACWGELGGVVAFLLLLLVTGLRVYNSG